MIWDAAVDYEQQQKKKKLKEKWHVNDFGETEVRKRYARLHILYIYMRVMCVGAGRDGADTMNNTQNQKMSGT